MQENFGHINALIHAAFCHQAITAREHTAYDDADEEVEADDADDVFSLLESWASFFAGFPSLPEDSDFAEAWYDGDR
jgi:hypothetical protein